ncbi:uncharacterized protein METZ01_LOCUS265458, partial [marine metagenome]
MHASEYQIRIIKASRRFDIRFSAPYSVGDIMVGNVSLRSAYSNFTFHRGEFVMAVDIGPIENFNVSDPELYRADTWQPYFERMRNEAPVHYCADSVHGPYWSISTYDLIKQVELDFKTFSNQAKLGGIQLQDIAQNLNRPSF